MFNIHDIFFFFSFLKAIQLAKIILNFELFLLIILKIN
jgi:hypothetical protein